MSPYLSAALPLILIVVFFVIPLYSLILVKSFQRKRRRSSLTAKLLRGPGETLRRELEDIQWELTNYVFALVMFPVMIYAVHISQSYWGQASETITRSVLIGTTLVAGTIFLWFKLYRLARLRFDIQNGLEAEIAMGQELDQLMREGAIVFHDFPAEGFNIDHVVLTRGGVYAVETKGRMKPDRNEGKKDATVEFNGEILSFPDWRDTKSIEQAKRQAKWLAKWLSSAVGESIGVRPAVALPGWWVHRTGRSDVTVISGREAPALLKGWQSVPFANPMMQRISHQLEQRCRNVEPTLYGKQDAFGRPVQQDRE